MQLSITNYEASQNYTVLGESIDYVLEVLSDKVVAFNDISLSYDEEYFSISPVLDYSGLTQRNFRYHLLPKRSKGEASIAIKYHTLSKTLNVTFEGQTIDSTFKSKNKGISKEEYFNAALIFDNADDYQAFDHENNMNFNSVYDKAYFSSNDLGVICLGYDSAITDISYQQTFLDSRGLNFAFKYTLPTDPNNDIRYASFYVEIVKAIAN